MAPSTLLALYISCISVYPVECIWRVWLSCRWCCKLHVCLSWAFEDLSYLLHALAWKHAVKHFQWQESIRGLSELHCILQHWSLMTEVWRQNTQTKQGSIVNMQSQSHTETQRTEVDSRLTIIDAYRSLQQRLCPFLPKVETRYQRSSNLRRRPKDPLQRAPPAPWMIKPIWHRSSPHTVAAVVPVVVVVLVVVIVVVVVVGR